MKKTLQKFILKLLLIGILLSITPITVNAAYIEGSRSTTPTYNEWTQKSNNWYYYENGKALKGWNEIGGYWFYFNTSGVFKKVGPK